MEIQNNNNEKAVGFRWRDVLIIYLIFGVCLWYSIVGTIKWLCIVSTIITVILGIPLAILTIFLIYSIGYTVLFQKKDANKTINTMNQLKEFSKSEDKLSRFAEAAKITLPESGEDSSETTPNTESKQTCKIDISLERENSLVCYAEYHNVEDAVVVFENLYMQSASQINKTGTASQTVHENTKFRYVETKNAYFAHYLFDNVVIYVCAYTKKEKKNLKHFLNQLQLPTQC